MFVSKVLLVLCVLKVAICTDDMVIGQLTTLVQQQAAKIQALEARLTTAETKLAAVENKNNLQDGTLANLTSTDQKLNSKGKRIKVFI